MSKQQWDVSESSNMSHNSHKSHIPWSLEAKRSSEGQRARRKWHFLHASASDADADWRTSGKDPRFERLMPQCHSNLEHNDSKWMNQGINGWMFLITCSNFSRRHGWFGHLLCLTPIHSAIFGACVDRFCPRVACFIVNLLDICRILQSSFFT